jgi:hypothetical protein
MVVSMPQPSSIEHVHRRFSWSDFVAANKWLTERIRILETQIAPINITCALGCLAFDPQLRRLAAYIAMGLILGMCGALDPPPPLISPGNTRVLHRRDDELRRLARSSFQRLPRVVWRAPVFTISWLILGGIAAFP